LGTQGQGGTVLSTEGSLLGTSTSAVFQNWGAICTREAEHLCRKGVRHLRGLGKNYLCQRTLSQKAGVGIRRGLQESSRAREKFYFHEGMISKTYRPTENYWAL